MLMSILFKSHIILSLAVVNICPTVKFIADDKTLLLQRSISLSFPLSPSLRYPALSPLLSVVYLTLSC
jgi:hypothetical protein